MAALDRLVAEHKWEEDMPDTKPAVLYSTTEFSTLVPSDEFYYQGCACVRIYTLGYLPVPALTYNAVNLLTGMAFRLEDSTLVEVITCPD